MIALVVMAPTAAQVLADVQKHYAKLPQLTMEFDEKATDAVFGRTVASHGTMYLAKPDLFRADFVKVVKQKLKLEKQFIYDGKQFWYVDHMNLEVHVSAVANIAIPAAASFLTNGNLANDYKVALANGKLVLTPKQPQADVAELDFVIDASHNVTESIVIAPSGNTEDFVFSKTTSGLQPPGTFAFDPKTQTPNYTVTMMAPPAAPPAPAAKPAAPAKPPAPAPPAVPVFLDPATP